MTDKPEVKERTWVWDFDYTQFVFGFGVTFDYIDFYFGPFVLTKSRKYK